MFEVDFYMHVCLSANSKIHADRGIEGKTGA